MSRISVAMCTFNGEGFLPEQLLSIAEQTLQPLELIVCDDGSTDRSLELIEVFARNVTFPVRVFRNPERLGSTRNFARCIGLCTGDLIALSDQDDRWEAGKLERLASVFASDPAIACVFSNGMLMDGNSQDMAQESWARFLFTPELQQTMLAGDAARVLLKLPVASGAAMVFRASLKHYTSGIPEGWIHDTWIVWMAALTGRLVPLNEPLIHYRIHGAQLLGLSAESGQQRLHRLGLLEWLERERREALRQYEHMARTYAALATFVDTHQLGTPEVRRAIHDKAGFAARALSLLNSPRLLRAAPSLLLARDYIRFTPRGLETILRHALL